MTRTIALVDDDQNILTSVTFALEAEGFKVRTYKDGAQALDGLGRQPADLAILDIKMPRLDGMELLSRLRQKTNLPVIFLTSKDDEIDVRTRESFPGRGCGMCAAPHGDNFRVDGLCNLEKFFADRL